VDPDAVKLQADQALRFDAEAKVLTAEGHVRLAYRGITLEADRLKVDLDHDLVQAEGNVRYRKGKDKIDAGLSSYDLKAEAGSFYDVKTSYRGDDLKGDVLVVGSFMASSKTVLRLANSNLTTCDLAEPHYHLEAREITVFLNDRLEAREVAYFEGHTRLFTLPYLVVPLKKENQFELPRFGYSGTDGWFIKTTYNYYRTGQAYGAFFLDWYERKGIGTGFKHNYAFGPKAAEGTGSTYLYLKGDRPQNDEEVFFGLDHRQKFGAGWTGSWRANYEDKYPSETQRQLVASSAMQVTQQTKTALTDLSATYRMQQTEYLSGAWAALPSDLRDMRVSLNTTQRLPKEWDWRFGASASRYYQVGKTAYDNFGYQTQLSRTFPDFIFRISAQQQFNPPQVAEGETPPPWNRYTRFPELALESRTLTYQGRPLPLTLSANVSRYEEFSTYHPNGYAQTMGSLTGRLTGLTYPLGTAWSANLTGSGTATYYQNGDYTLGATAGTGLTFRPVQAFSTGVRYNWQDKLGANPFSSTGISPAQYVTYNANYSANGLTADLSTGYNILGKYAQEVVSRVTYTRPKVSASGMVSFDPNTGSWRRASAIYSYQASETKLAKLGATVDLATSRVERLDAQLAAGLTALWRAELTMSYDGYSSQLSRGEVALTRDIHCRELRFRYDAVRQEMWVELRIKALPTGVLRLGASEQRLMFDAQSLGGLLGSETTTPGVPR
jgi:hypothetical protein